MRYDMISILRGRGGKAIPRQVGSNVVNRGSERDLYVHLACSIQQTQNMLVRRVRRLPWARAPDLRCSSSLLEKQASCEEHCVFQHGGAKICIYNEY